MCARVPLPWILCILPRTTLQGILVCILSVTFLAGCFSWICTREQLLVFLCISCSSLLSSIKMVVPPAVVWCSRRVSRRPLASLPYNCFSYSCKIWIYLFDVISVIVQLKKKIWILCTVNEVMYIGVENIVNFFFYFFLNSGLYHSCVGSWKVKAGDLEKNRQWEREWSDSLCSREQYRSPFMILLWSIQDSGF